MPSQLHFEPGAAATDYIFECILSVSTSGNDYIARQCEAFVTTRWGMPYPYSGFMQLVQYNRSASPPDLTPVETRVAYLQSLMLGGTGPTYIVAGPFTVSSYTRVIVRGAEMTATPCGDATFTFTDLEYYVDDPGTGTPDWVLSTDGTLGAGPYSFPVTAYNQAENQTRIQFGCNSDPAYTHLNLDCAGPKTAVSVTIGDYAKGGWAWDSGGSWQAEPITIDALALPATTWPPGCIGSCTCSTALGGVSETDSFNVTVNGELYYNLAVVGPVPITCTCPLGDTVDFDKYTYTAELREKSGWIDAISENDATLHSSVRHRQAGCGCQFPLLDSWLSIIETDTTDGISYAAQYQTVSRSVMEIQCTYGLLVCVERWFDVDPPPPVCLLVSAPMCYYDGYVLQQPYASCQGEALNPYNLITRNGHYLEAYESGGNIFVRRSQFTGPDFAANMTTVTVAGTGDCDHPKLFEHIQTGQIICTFHKAGAGIYYSVSASNGRNWGTVTHLGEITGDPVYPDVYEGLDGSTVVMGFKYNSGSSGPGKIYFVRKAAGDLTYSSEVAFKDDAGTDMVFADTTFHVVRIRENAFRPTLVCKIDGETEISRWWTPNNFKNWKRGT